MQPVSRLPIANLDHAVALASIGFAVSPKAYLNEKSAARSLTWFCDSGQAQAQALLHSLSVANPAKRLDALKPEAPILAALAALRTARAVAYWRQAGNTGIPCIARIGTGRLCAAEAGIPAERDLVRVLAERRAAASVSMQPAAVAALIVCGFIPHAALTAEGAKVAMPALSDTFPGLSISDAVDLIQRAFCDPAVLCSAVIGDAAPGEHPLCYALAALRTEATFRESMAQAHRDPVVMMRGKGTRSALVSSSLMREGRKDNFRDIVARHKAGLPH